MEADLQELKPRRNIALKVFPLVDSEVSGLIHSWDLVLFQMPPTATNLAQCCHFLGLPSEEASEQSGESLTGLQIPAIVTVFAQSPSSPSARHSRRSRRGIAMYRGSGTAPAPILISLTPNQARYRRHGLVTRDNPRPVRKQGGNPV